MKTHKARKARKFTYNDLVFAKVINTTFEPSVEQYAKVFLFEEDYFSGKRKFVVTKEPQLWAFALRRLRREELPFQTLMEVIKTAKALRKQHPLKNEELPALRIGRGRASVLIARLLDS